jgi:hypothetical protein
VTLIVHVAFAATDVLLHVFVCAKSPVTVIAAAPNVSAEPPVFLTVTVCAVLVVEKSWPVKVNVLGVTLATGAATAAVPVIARDPAGVALSVNVRVAVRGLGVVPEGVNVMAIVQVAFGCTTAPLVQVVPDPATIVKSVLGVPPVPVIAGAAVRLSAALPVFFTVTVCAVLVVLTVWLANVNGGVGEVIVTIGAVATPVPLRPYICGLPVPLSVKDRVPVRGLVAEVGVKVTLTVHVAVGCTVVLLQVFVWAKSPLAAIAEAPNINGAFPVLVTVTVWAALVVPTTWLLKVNGW